MNTKRIRSLPALTALTLSIMACNAVSTSIPNATQAPETNINEATSAPAATEASTEASVETMSACDNPYMPVIVGATWNYKLNGPIPDTYTHTIVSLDGNGFTEQDVFGAGVTRQGQWTCENGNLIALNPPSGSSGTVDADNVQVDFQTKDLSGVTLPGTINAGDTWSQSLTLEGTETINGAEYPARNQITSDCKAIGVESVTVEAGTFDAMRVECRNVMNISIKIGDNETATTLDLTGISWYAEHVGMVKNTTAGSGLDSTTELVSYNIPY